MRWNSLQPRFSLRQLLVVIFLFAVILGIYETNYGRPKRAVDYFQSAGVQVATGNPCPANHVYMFDSFDRGDDDFPKGEDGVFARFQFPAIRQLVFAPSLESGVHLPGAPSIDLIESIPSQAPHVEAMEFIQPQSHLRRMKDMDRKRLYNSLAQLKELRYIQLSQFDLNDDDVAQLATLPKLQYLQIGGTSMGDQGLIALQKCPDLKFIGLVGTKVRKQGIVDFVRQRPGIVMNTPYGWVGNHRLLHGSKQMSEDSLSRREIFDASTP